MPNRPHVDDDRALPNASPPDDHPASELVAIVWEEDPPLCAVLPRGATFGSSQTEWLTARDDAFVDLEDVR